MLAETQDGLQRIMDKLNPVPEDYGMKINIKKTKVMVVTRGTRPALHITIHGELIEQVEEFCYLGSVITEDGKCHREVRRRMALGKAAFQKRKELLRGAYLETQRRE